MEETRPRKRKLKVVKYRPSNDVKVLLEQALARAQSGETLAVALVEIKGAGEIHYEAAGADRGFRHQLVAGSVYLLDDLKADE